MIAILLALVAVANAFQIISPIQNQPLRYGQQIDVTVDVGQIPVANFSISFGGEVICSVQGELRVSGLYSCPVTPIQYGTKEIVAQGTVGLTVLLSNVTVVVMPVRGNEAVNPTMDPLSGLNSSNIWQGSSDFNQVNVWEASVDVYELIGKRKPIKNCLCRRQ